VIAIEVVLALPREARCVRVELPAGSTAAQAAIASGLPLEGIDGYAVYGRRVRADEPMRDGDRLELLRPLAMDPKEARRRRAARNV
jgi:putative ubiquitin-RnfH superfamily antitoxin RatB of RatAB toxin-antitoxin module